MLEIDALSTEQVGPISLSVSSGECVAIMGASGSGKSLFLRAIADLDPNEGTVKLDSQSRNEMPAHQWRRLVSLIPAETGWWGDRVREHLEETPDLEELLKAVNLQRSRDWEVNRLSTGERHRLAIVRALQTKPKALLLDEPTASLDAQMTAAVEKLIKQQLAKGVSVLMVTHDPEQAARMASRSFTMAGGKLAPDREFAK